MKGAIRFLLENSLFLIMGAVAALIWANVDYEAYHHFVETQLGHFSWIGHAEFKDGVLVDRHLTLHFLVNDIGMAFFFAIAAKEVWEAMLPGGDLSSFKTAGAPLLATATARNLEPSQACRIPQTALFMR